MDFAFGVFAALQIYQVLFAGPQKEIGNGLIYKPSGVFIRMAAAAEGLCVNRAYNPCMGLVTVKTVQSLFQM